MILTLSQTNSSNQQQSSKEVQQLSKTLLEHGFTAAVIEANYDLLLEALRLSESGGMQELLPDTRYSPIEGGFVPVAAYDRDGIHRRYRTLRDPVELFEKLKRSREDQRREQQRKAQEWKETVERQWYLYDRSVCNGYRSQILDRDGKSVTKEWFYQNQYACPRNNCFIRFKTEDELRRHIRYDHSGNIMLQ